MKKTFLIFSLSLILTSFLFSSTLHFGPYLQSAKPDGITILWETTEPFNGKVIFGNSPDKLDKSLSETRAGKLHIIKIKGLEPNQKYFYQCFWGNESTEIFIFKTAPLNNGIPVRIAIIGDSRSQPEIFAKVCQQVTKYNPDIILHSGDLVASGDRIEQWKPQFFEPAKELSPTVPIYPTLGNHERKAGYYFQHFTIHEGKPWWSADYGSVHIIGLNSSEDSSPTSEQYKWLVEDLNKSQDKTWKIAMFHYPLFHVHPTRPVYDIRYYWTPLFIKHNVNFVITGHDHYYCRTFPIGNMSEKQQGPIHITSAGGGAPLYPVIPQPFAAYFRSIYHFVILDVTENQISGKAISIDGDVFDTFSLHKDQDFMAENFIEYEMFELEQRIKFSLGEVTPIAEQNNEVHYDTNIVIKTNFKKPVVGYYHWKSQDNWKFQPPVKEKIMLQPGAPMIIPLKAKTIAENMIPSPILKIHIEADNSTRNVSNSRPLDHFIGFKNQDINISFEEAIFSRSISGNSNEIKRVFSYLKYFSKSKNSDHVVDYLGAVFSKDSKKLDLSYLDNFLKQNSSPENKYRFYPFYFAARDYTYFDEWLELADEFAPYKIDLSNQLISRITRRKEVNSFTIKNWWVLSPFPNENNNGLTVPYKPEKNVKLSQRYQGYHKQNIKWEQRAANSFGHLDLLGDLSSNEKFLCYAYTTFETTAKGKVLLLFGSNDGAIVWVNGKQYFRRDEGRSARACDDIIPVPVKKGKNEILVKVAQEGGSWGLYLQVLDKLHLIKLHK
jgi:acid phosphatase type 7